MSEKSTPTIHDRLLTIREASQLVDVPANTLRRWADRGAVRVYRIGSRFDRRFREKDLVQLMERKEGSRSRPG
jgi:excisionase family DNA binding protein